MWNGRECTARTAIASCRLARLIASLLLFSALPALAQTGISGAEAIDATKQMLQARGFAPPPGSGLDYRDYIAVTPGHGDAMTRVLLRFDAKGRLIPTRSWQQYHPGYCKRRSREAHVAKTRLRFKLTRQREQADGMVREQTSVFAGSIDADTNIIAEQRQAAGSQLWRAEGGAVVSGLNNLSPECVGHLMAIAWDALQFRGTGMAGPCGPEQEQEQPDGPIQPRDGLWRITMVDQSLASCSSRIAGRLKSMTAGLRYPDGLHQLDFAAPFHPEPLLGKGPPVAWERTGMNSWHALLHDSGGGEISIVVTVDAKVLSPTLITEREVFDMPGFCRAVSDFELHWV